MKARKSRAKWQKGERVTSLAMYLVFRRKHMFIFGGYRHKVYHRGWLDNWSLMQLESAIKHGVLYIAKPKGGQIES